MKYKLISFDVTKALEKGVGMMVQDLRKGRVELGDKSPIDYFLEIGVPVSGRNLKMADDLPICNFFTELTSEEIQEQFEKDFAWI